MSKFLTIGAAIFAAALGATIIPGDAIEGGLMIAASGVLLATLKVQVV